MRNQQSRDRPRNTFTFVAHLYLCIYSFGQAIGQVFCIHVESVTWNLVEDFKLFFHGYMHLLYISYSHLNRGDIGASSQCSQLTIASPSVLLTAAGNRCAENKRGRILPGLTDKHRMMRFAFLLPLAAVHTVIPRRRAKDVE